MTTWINYRRIRRIADGPTASPTSREDYHDDALPPEDREQVDPWWSTPQVRKKEEKK